MAITTSIGIVADDLTGANDTALQFHLAGANTQIILNINEEFEPSPNIQAWAIPTESRNISPAEAISKVEEVVSFMKDKLEIENFYKKIDSTLRGNIAVETLTMLKILEWDAAVIIPAFPNEGRITVGGYHLLKGVPLEKTEMASDPHSPIYESHIPTILEKQIGEENTQIIGSIELKTVLKGAGPIITALNKLVADGKKLIVVDAVSITDLEQVMLAIDKTSYNILPCGSAGAAQAMSKILVPENKNQHTPKTIAPLPKLIISGSATQLTANQIKKLSDNDEFENIYPISLSEYDFINGISEELYDRIKNQIQQKNVVIVHSSDLSKDESLQKILLDSELTRKEFATKIVVILADLVQKLSNEKEFILISVGGETSYECCKQLKSACLNLVDSVAPAIPLCIDNNGNLVVTKSGNLGTVNTLVEILKYFERH